MGYNFSFYRKIFQTTVLLGMAAGLVGCFDEPSIAPVVNAWYQPGADDTYLVHRGDTIYSIAWAFGVDYRALARVNHLQAPYEITAGQRLVMTTVPRGRSVKYAYAVPRQTYVVPKKIVSKPVEKTESHYVGPAYVSGWQWPTKGRLVERFTSGVAGSQGIAIAGKYGQPILAAAKGEVVYSGDGVRGYGNLVIIKHNRNYLSAYAYNQQNLVKVGEIVSKGSVIARMGRNDAGRTLLYFEIRRDGHPVNPLQFLK